MNRLRVESAGCSGTDGGRANVGFGCSYRSLWTADARVRCATLSGALRFLMANASSEEVLIVRVDAVIRKKCKKIEILGKCMEEIRIQVCKKI